MPSSDGGDDMVWVGGPGEGLWVCIGLGDEAVDGGLQVDDGAEDAALEATSADLLPVARDQAEVISQVSGLVSNCPLGLFVPTDVESRFSFEECDFVEVEFSSYERDKIAQSGGLIDRVANRRNDNAGGCTAMTVSIQPVPDVIGVVLNAGRALQMIEGAKIVNRLGSKARANDDRPVPRHQWFQNVITEARAGCSGQVGIIRDVDDATHDRNLGIEKLPHVKIGRQPHPTKAIEFAVERALVGREAH